MPKSKRVSMSKAKLAATGEELEVEGAMTTVAGAMQAAEGLEDLEVARAAGGIGVAAVAAGASDLTRAADAAVVAEKVQQLSDLVGAAGIVDVAEGADMLMKGGDVRAMGAIVSLMSQEELERGLELARLAGELWTVSEVLSMLDMPVLADFLEARGEHLQDIAVDQLLRYTGTRALAGAMKETAKDIEAMGENEVAEGLVRVAASQVAAPLIEECYASLECRVADTRLVNRYNFFILEVVQAWVDSAIKQPQTLHHRGNGVFVVAGETIKLRSAMK